MHAEAPTFWASKLKGFTVYTMNVLSNRVNTSNVQRHKGLTHHLFLISDIRALWRSGLSARVPECQKLKMVG